MHNQRVGYVIDTFGSKVLLELHVHVNDIQMWQFALRCMIGRLISVQECSAELPWEVY